jgi:hypothetical protein
LIGVDLPSAPLATAWLGFLAGLIGGAISGVTAALLAVYGNTRSRRSVEAAVLALERRAAFADLAVALGSFIAASLDLRYAGSSQPDTVDEPDQEQPTEEAVRSAMIDLERASTQTKDALVAKLTAEVLGNYVTWRLAAAEGELPTWRRFWESCVSLKKNTQSEVGTHSA